MKVAQSCPTLCDPMDYNCPWNSLGPNTGVGSSSLLHGIFPTQESNPGLPCYRQIRYCLSHEGSPSLLQGILPIQESIQGLLHSRQILYQGSYQGAQCLKLELLFEGVIRYLRPLQSEWEWEQRVSSGKVLILYNFIFFFFLYVVKSLCGNNSESPGKKKNVLSTLTSPLGILSVLDSFMSALTISYKVTKHIDDNSNVW